ncbi:MAG: hypothetical protein M5U26_21275 [Planctomycetota bacterium]|nr:hypothetical protein [Planctomycetota bacterium]
MSKVLRGADAKLPTPLKVVYFSKRKEPAKDGSWFEDVSKRVVRLEIEGPEGEPESPHLLVRRDAQGKLVWKTRHASLQEALWHAEWEYGLAEAAWKTA